MADKRDQDSKIGPGARPAPERPKESEEWLDAYFRGGPDATFTEPTGMSAQSAALFGLHRPAASAPPEGTDAHAATPRSAPDVAGADTLRDLQDIAGLLHRLRDVTATPSLAPQALNAQTVTLPLRFVASAAAGPVTMVSSDQLVALLSELQTGTEAPATGTVLDIRAALDAIAASRGGMDMARNDRDVLDIVTLFFDMVTEDRDLPPAIQGQIARLQLPVLKLALLDRSFFTDRTHPARQLIDAIARSGAGWDSADKPGQDSLLALLEALVGDLLAQDAPGLDAFGKALETVNGHLARAEQRAQKLERRTAEKAQAEARTLAARDAVHALLAERLDGRDLPEPVLEFVTQDWQRVLQLLYLRKGKESAEWKDATALVEELVQTAAVPEDPEQRAGLEGSLPAFYERLANGLEMTQGNTGEAQERVNTLRAMHRARLDERVQAQAPAPAILRRVKIEPPPLIAPRGTPAGAAPATTAAAEPVAGALTLESLKRADEVPVGTWFEYENPGNRATRRIKLSARIEATRTLLFCDHLGNAVAEKSRKQFALELQAGHLRVIEETPLVDRTIGRIAATLRQQAAEG